MVDLISTKAPAAVPTGAPTLPGAIAPAARLSERFAAAEVTGARGVRLREVPFVSMVGLRVQPGSAAADRVADRLGVTLPRGVGEVAAGERGAVVWFAPDELLLASDEASTALTADLVDALADGPGSVVDLSANRTTLELSGPGAREVLEKGCALDLHPRAFAVGAAYLTLVGSVPVVLWKVADETFRLLPRSSYADFLGRWLLDAIAELAAPEPPAWR